MTETTAMQSSEIAPPSAERQYQQRLARYVTAMRNEKPDMVPIRPFVAEFTAKYAGMDCQQVTQDYRLAFDAAVRCAEDFDWDAVVANMVYVWGTVPQLLGTKYLAVPERTDPPKRIHDRPLGTVVPWPVQRAKMPEMTGDEQLVQKTWEEIDAWTYSFVWHCMVSC